MILQNDSLTNMSIADDTRKDSHAMKTIAVLTTVFLPATFTAVRFWQIESPSNSLVQEIYADRGH